MAAVDDRDAWSGATCFVRVPALSAKPTTGLLFVLAGFVLFAVGYLMEVTSQTYDVRELPNGMLELIPRPWKAACECFIVFGHACIFVGLLGEAFPQVLKRLQGICFGFSAWMQNK